MWVNGRVAEIEAGLLSVCRDSEPMFGPLFILGAPRTGSTFLYQAMAAAFELPYIANLTNDGFAETPIVGLSIQAAWPSFGQLSAESRYGKTLGPFQPSEGSAVMRHWFGGGHPSELVSREALPDRIEHMRATIRAATRIFGRPLLIKNAWNCFRIEALARLFPNAAFVWIRRDIGNSATSDLNARYAVHGDPLTWNSATPRNVEALRKLPYWEQVVENQVAFGRAIEEGFSELPAGRVATIWYEDLCAAPSSALGRLAGMLECLAGVDVKRTLPVRSPKEDYGALQPCDRERLTAYVTAQAQRLSSLVYREGGTR
jgi:Sulfotransferase family